MTSSSSLKYADLPCDGLPGTQPLCQFRPSTTRDVADRDGDGLFLTDQYNQPCSTCDAGVEKVPLQHGVVLRHDRMTTAGYSDPSDLWIVAAQKPYPPVFPDPSLHRRTLSRGQHEKEAGRLVFLLDLQRAVAFALNAAPRTKSHIGRTGFFCFRDRTVAFLSRLRRVREISEATKPTQPQRSYSAGAAFCTPAAMLLEITMRRKPAGTMTTSVTAPQRCSRPQCRNATPPAPGVHPLPQRRRDPGARAKAIHAIASEGKPGPASRLDFPLHAPR